MLKTAIHGWVDRRFAAVADAFAGNFSDAGELGAAVALYAHGRKVVDLWSGTADVRSGRPWTESTPVVLFSASKGVVAICVADLVDTGRLDLGAPVRRYWPEFGCAGKEHVTVRCLLSHRAGLPTVTAPLSFSDVLAWTPVTSALAAQLPQWPPGTTHGYHPLTFGWLAGELVRRVTGDTPGSYLRQRYADPLGLDLWIGLPSREHQRLARLEHTPSAGSGSLPHPDIAELEQAMTLSGALPAAAADGGNTFNDPEVLAAEIPAANAVGTARDLAKLYATTVASIDGSSPWKPSTISRFVAVQAVDAPSADGGGARRWGPGFMLHSPPAKPMLGPRSFGHDGASGCLAFADEEHRAGFAYVTNRMPGPDDERANRLTAAVRDSLSQP